MEYSHCYMFFTPLLSSTYDCLKLELERSSILPIHLKMQQGSDSAATARFDLFPPGPVDRPYPCTSKENHACASQSCLVMSCLVHPDAERTARAGCNRPSHHHRKRKPHRNSHHHQWHGLWYSNPLRCPGRNEPRRHQVKRHLSRSRAAAQHDSRLLYAERPQLDH